MLRISSIPPANPEDSSDPTTTTNMDTTSQDPGDSTEDYIESPEDSTETVTTETKMEDQREETPNTRDAMKVSKDCLKALLILRIPRPVKTAPNNNNNNICNQLIFV